MIAPTVPIADSRPTVDPLAGHVGQRRADDHRGHGRQDRGRRDERDRGEDDDRNEAVAEADAPDRADDRDRRDRRQAAEHERRAEQRPRPEGIRGQAAEPCPERDPGQDRADDPGVRRQRDADVRRQQPPRRDLEDEHARGGEEGQGGGDRPAEAALGARSGGIAGMVGGTPAIGRERPRCRRSERVGRPFAGARGAPAGRG